MNRTSVYKTYKEIDNKKLLKQQIFLSSYITSNFNSIDKLLLFHGIGSGKTCTSITIAESIMKTNKNYKVLVLLPARLKTNFIDELISETCGNLYISTEDYNKYINPALLRISQQLINKYPFITLSDASLAVGINYPIKTVISKG